MLPDQFLRIQFRRVGREAFRDDLRMARKIVTDHASTIVDVSPIPDDRQRAADMLVNLLQKPHGVSGVGVGVVSQQGHIQVEALLFGADRDRADDRDPVMPIPRLQDRCFAARRIRSTHGGIEHIAGFIEEDQRRASVLGFFLSAEILHSSIARSPSHRVPVHGIQAFEASNSGCGSSISARALMILNVEILLNQVHYAPGSPQLIGPAVGFRTLSQKEFQVMKLSFRQIARRAGMSDGFQAVRSAQRHPAPAVKRSSFHAKNFGNLSMGLPAAHQFDGVNSTPLKFFCRSKWSHAYTIDIHS